MMDSQPVPTTPPGKINWRLIGRGVLLLILLGLCGFGLAATPFWKQHTLNYWMWMVPCFGLLAILLCLLSDTRRHNMLHWKVLQHQVLQWIGTAAAVYLLFWMIRQNFFNVEAAGPTVTLIIALSIYMAGITFDWSLVVVALLLGAMAVGAVYLERAILVVVGLAVILGIAYLLLRPVIKNYRRPHAPETPPSSPGSGVSSDLR
jgi:peptidoglycan/LPS O-acetylase OafA/YrhL